MIPRRSRAGMAILSALALLSFWANRQVNQDDLLPGSDIDTAMEYMLRDFEVRYFDESGEQTMTLRSPRFSSDAASGEGQAFNPIMEINHEGFVWNIIADAARFPDSQERVFLDGAVRIVREGALEQDWLQIDTQEVTVEVEDRIAHSMAPVRAQDLAGEFNATGFQVNMTENTFELEQQVRGVYVLP